MKKSYITISYIPVETSILSHNEGLKFTVNSGNKQVTYDLMPADRDDVFECLYPERKLPLDFEYVNLSEEEMWKLFEYFEDQLVIDEVTDIPSNDLGPIQFEPEPWVSPFSQFVDTLAGFR